MTAGGSYPLEVILAIDDSIVVLSQAEHFLKQRNPTSIIHKAKNGKDAIALVDQHHRSLKAVFIDYNMGGMNGLEIVDQIKSKISLSRMALLTGNIQDAVVQETVKRGIRFIAKPMTQEIFNEFMNSLGDV